MLSFGRKMTAEPEKKGKVHYPNQPVKRKRASLKETGRSGLDWNPYGYVSEEFLDTLRGANGIRIYKEMSSNDPIIGGCLFAIEQLFREARWSVALPEGGSEEDRDFLIQNMTSMDFTWGEFVTEVLAMFTYGWEVFELVYRNFGGKIWWKRFAPRAQSTLSRWDIAYNGDLLGMYQTGQDNAGEVYIPVEKMLHFRTTSRLNNPEGKSILRNAFRPWYFKKNLEELEGIGIERDLTGLAVMTLPEGMKMEDASSADAVQWAQNILTNVRNDEQAGVLKPHGWEFELISSPGQKQIDPGNVINRYSKEMAISMLAQFIMLGMERTGSYALSRNITSLFFVCLEGYLDYITSVVNKKAVRDLFAFNGKFEHLPYIVHTPIRSQTLTEIAKYVSDLVKAEAIDVDAELKTYLKKFGRLEEYSETRF